MRKKITVGLIGLGLGWSMAAADVSEMIFYPEADFAEGIFHFNYQGDKHKNYAFMFEKGFDPERIVYVRPANHRIEKLSEGMLKVSFANTDRYSYLQRAYRDDFLVSDENGIVKILLSGGDCKSSSDCVTAENILTVNVPKGYAVRKLQGLDQDLRPLKNPQWQRKGNTFTLTARDVKGACIMMELERLRPGQAALHAPLPAASRPVALKPAAPEPAAPSVPAVVVASPAPKPPVVEVNPKPVVEPALPSAPVAVPEPKPEPVAAVVTPPAAKPSPAPVSAAEKAAEPPHPYFRNFQLFENQAVVGLSREGKARLAAWAKAFLESGYRSVTVEGYTDSIPPQRLKYLYATNEILSTARAQAVADYLATQGIDASRITVVGKGALNPVASNDTEEGRSKNRRIEFVLR